MSYQLMAAEVSRLYAAVRKVQNNASWLQREASQLELPADLCSAVDDVREEIVGTVHDLRHELATLEYKLGMRAGEEPLDPGVNPDPRVTLNFIGTWLRSDHETAAAFAARLGERRAESDGAMHLHSLIAEVRDNLGVIADQLAQRAETIRGLIEHGIPEAPPRPRRDPDQEEAGVREAMAALVRKLAGLTPKQQIEKLKALYGLNNEPRR